MLSASECDPICFCLVVPVFKSITKAYKRIPVRTNQCSLSCQTVKDKCMKMMAHLSCQLCNAVAVVTVYENWIE